MKFLKDVKVIPSDHYIQQGTRIKSVPMRKMETIEDSVKNDLSSYFNKKREGVVKKMLFFKVTRTF